MWALVANNVEMSAIFWRNRVFQEQPKVDNVDIKRFSSVITVNSAMGPFNCS